MEKVITLLYDIEEKANRILDRTAEEKAALYQELNANMEEMDAQINKETQKKLKDIQARFEKEIASDTQALIEASKKHLSEIESNCKQNHEVLVNEIFEQIIAE